MIEPISGHMKILLLSSFTTLFCTPVAVKAGTDSAAVGSSAAIKSVNEQCTDARSILEAALIDRAGPDDVLSLDPPEFVYQPLKGAQGIGKMTPFGPESAYWRIGWQGHPPSTALVQGWYKHPYGSIARCFLPRTAEQSLVTILGANLQRFRPFDGSEPSIVRISYPAFDRAKAHAILLYSRAFRSGLGGKLELISLTRTKSGWKKTGFRYLGAS